MTILEGLKRIIKKENEPIDIWHYLIGNYRYKLYYNKKYISKNHPLLRLHIWEQIKYRISVMNKECFKNGSCIKCGCDTTQLQMANKRCDGICYPTMMNKEDWEKFKQGRLIIDNKGDGVWITMSSIDGKGERTKKHIFYKETSNSYVPINQD